ncbi:MAG: hypothetical protein AB7G87_03705 [Clostridia bacterium]
MLERIKGLVEGITKGETVVTSEQLEAIMETEYTYVENCGNSGRYDGTLYSVRLMGEDGNDTGEEIAEVVVVNG